MGTGDRRMAALPAVHALTAGFTGRMPGERLTALARELLDGERARLRAEPEAAARSEEALALALDSAIRRELAPGYPRVINATGVVLHTNLGRAPLSEPARRAVLDAAGYCALEMSLETGKRSERDAAVVRRLIALTGCEDALVVNNNAAAMLLVLAAFGREGGAVLSRGELVEIGGSFRMPEVMAASGVALHEVGTTNRTHLEDYRAGLEAGASLLLRVHRSNFYVEGFTKQVPLEDLVELARERSVPLCYDLGSGRLDGDEPGEPGLRRAMALGTDLVCVSGDKLLGGPQAGIVLGRAELISRLRKHPLKRALRCDKLTLAGLEAVLRQHLGYAEGARPVDEALAAAPEALRRRAESLLRSIRERLPELDRRCATELREVSGRVGGGSSPEARLGSWAVALAPTDAGPAANRLAERLRRGDPPVVARVHKDAVELHPLTLLPGDEEGLLDALARALSELASQGGVQED